MTNSYKKIELTAETARPASPRKRTSPHSQPSVKYQQANPATKNAPASFEHTPPASSSIIGSNPSSKPLPIALTRNVNNPGMATQPFGSIPPFAQSRTNGPATAGTREPEAWGTGRGKGYKNYPISHSSGELLIDIDAIPAVTPSEPGSCQADEDLQIARMRARLEKLKEGLPRFQGEIPSLIDFSDTESSGAPAQSKTDTFHEDQSKKDDLPLIDFSDTESFEFPTAPVRSKGKVPEKRSEDNDPLLVSLHRVSGPAPASARDGLAKPKARDPNQPCPYGESWDTKFDDLKKEGTRLDAPPLAAPEYDCPMSSYKGIYWDAPIEWYKIDDRTAYRKGHPLLRALPLITHPSSLSLSDLVPDGSAILKDLHRLLDLYGQVTLDAEPQLFHRAHIGEAPSDKNLTLVMLSNMDNSGSWGPKIEHIRTLLNHHGLRHIFIEMIDPRVFEHGLYTFPLLSQADDRIIEFCKAKRDEIANILDESGLTWDLLRFCRRGVSKERRECRVSVVIVSPEADHEGWWEGGPEVIPKLMRLVGIELNFHVPFERKEKVVGI